MAETDEDLELYEKNRFSFNRPIPGQSLTNDPASPMAFEKPPEFTNVDDAVEYFFAMIVDEETHPRLISLLRGSFPIMDLTEILLYNAFVEGKINPDMLLLLAEPIAYMLLYISDMAMFDPVITRPEEDEDVTLDDKYGTRDEFNLEATMKKAGKATLDKEPSEVLSPDIIDKLQQAPSLLAAPQETAQ